MAVDTLCASLILEKERPASRVRGHRRRVERLSAQRGIAIDHAVGHREDWCAPTNRGKAHRWLACACFSVSARGARAPARPAGGGRHLDPAVIAPADVSFQPGLEALGPAEPLPAAGPPLQAPGEGFGRGAAGARALPRHRLDAPHPSSMVADKTRRCRKPRPERAMPPASPMRSHIGGENMPMTSFTVRPAPTAQDATSPAYRSASGDRQAFEPSAPSSAAPRPSASRASARLSASWDGSAPSPPPPRASQPDRRLSCRACSPSHSGRLALFAWPRVWDPSRPGSAGTAGASRAPRQRRARSGPTGRTRLRPRP